MEETERVASEFCIQDRQDADLFSSVDLCKVHTPQLGALYRVTFYHTQQTQHRAENYLKKYVDTMCRYRHPNVVTVFSVDYQPGWTGLQMEYPEYGDFYNYMKTHEITWGELVDVVRDVLKGLVFLEVTKSVKSSDLQLNAGLSNIWMYRGLAKVACCGLPMIDRMFQKALSPDDGLSPPISVQSHPGSLQRQGSKVYRFGFTLLEMIAVITGEEDNFPQTWDQLELPGDCPTVLTRLIGICLTHEDMNSFAELYSEFQRHSPMKVFSTWDVSLHNFLVPKNQRWLVYKHQVFEYKPQTVPLSNDSDTGSSDDDDSDYDGDADNDDDYDHDDDFLAQTNITRSSVDGDTIAGDISPCGPMETGQGIALPDSRPGQLHAHVSPSLSCDSKFDINYNKGTIPTSNGIHGCDVKTTGILQDQNKEIPNANPDTILENPLGQSELVRDYVSEDTRCYEYVCEEALDRCSMGSADVDSGEDAFSESWQEVTKSQCNETSSSIEDNGSLCGYDIEPEDSVDGIAEEDTNCDLSTCEQMTDYDENGITNDGIDLSDDDDLYSRRSESGCTGQLPENETGILGQNVHIISVNGTNCDDIGFFSDDGGVLGTGGNRALREQIGSLSDDDFIPKTESENNTNCVHYDKIGFFSDEDVGYQNKLKQSKTCKNFVPNEEIDLFIDEEELSVANVEPEEHAGSSCDSDTISRQEVSDDNIVSTDEISFSDEEFSYQRENDESDIQHVCDEEPGIMNENDLDQKVQADLNPDLKNEIGFLSDEDLGYEHFKDTSISIGLSVEEDLNAKAKEYGDNPVPIKQTGCTDDAISNSASGGENCENLLNGEEIGFLNDDDLRYLRGQKRSGQNCRDSHSDEEVCTAIGESKAGTTVVADTLTDRSCHNQGEIENSPIPYEEIGFFSDDEIKCVDRCDLNVDKEHPGGDCEEEYLNNEACDNRFSFEQNAVIDNLTDNCGSTNSLGNATCCTSLPNALDFLQKASETLSLADFPKSCESNIVNIKGVNHTVGRRLGVVQQLSPCQYWLDYRMDLVILLQDIGESRDCLSDKCVLNDYRNCLLRKLKDIDAGQFEHPKLPPNKDPNARAAPVPREIHSDTSCLRPWLNDWVPFDTALPETGCVWEELEYSIVSPSETKDLTKTPWYGEWKPFDMSIEGEAAWKSLPADVIANDLPTKQQIKVMNYRQGHKHCQDENFMTKRRQQLGEYFKKKYGLESVTVDRYLEFVSRLKENEEDLKSLTDMDFSFIIV